MSKYSFSISRKVWLGLSILIIGYMVSMIFGFIRGRETETRLHRVSGSVFPAAVQSKVALTKFNEQAKLYNDAVVFGEEAILKDAETAALASQEAVKLLVDLMENDKPGKNAVQGLLKELTGFTAAAGSLYSRMLREIDSETFSKKASEMTRDTEKLRQKLSALTDTFSNHLKSELVNISNASRDRRYWSMIVFIFVVSVSFILVSILIRRAVTRPLQKVAELATAMAEGDLSRKLDIRQKDEIGGLARAMNLMAEEIEASHALLEQKVAERTASLKETNVKLREEIAERERTGEELKKTRDQLVEAAREAEEANRSKSEFLANMSHEIRTPLTGVIGMTEMLMYTPLSSEQKDYIETINISSETLLTIINDILDLSKIEAGEFSLASEPFDLEKAVHGVARIIAPQAEKKKLDVRVLFQPGVSYRVVGDQIRVRQIIFNLVGNAVKFTHEGGIDIRVHSEDRCEDNCHFHIEIKDTGIGIEPAFIDAIFDKFTQVDASHTRKYGGTGLGLPVTRQLVEIMGGSLRVESTPGKGSVFHVVLPLSMDTETDEAVPDESLEETAEEIGPMGVNRGGTGYATILLAEDNKINQKLIRAIIKKAGYYLDIVEDGKAALEKVRTGAYDLVLMDIQMPEMNGLDATKAIRQAGFAEIPVIAMTASAFEKDRKMCLDAGMNDFISKPLKQTDLLRMIFKWTK